MDTLGVNRISMEGATMTQQLNTHGIGASEIAAIAGMNPYCSPWDVWLRKTGQTADNEANRFTEWGHRLEPAIRQAYVDQTKATVMVPTESMFHRSVHWARATPDGIVLDQGPVSPGAVWQALVQCKNVGSWVEKSWKEAPPVYVQLQELWEMYVTDLPRADVAVLIGGNDFRVYTIHRDDKMIGDLVTIASEFWRRVETRTPPEIDDSDACRDHFTKKLARADAVELTADERMNALFGEWRELASRAKADKKRIETIRTAVIAELAGAKASSLKSTHGTARLTIPVPKSETIKTTNWQLIAELLGSTKCAPEEWAAMLETATTASTVVSEGKPTLYAPREWSKE